MKKNAIKLSIFVSLFLIVLFGAFNIKTNADTNYAIDLQPYVVNDWENYTNQTKNGVSLTNNGDGTLTFSGQATAITEFVLPITMQSTTSGLYYTVYFACPVDNQFIGNDSRARLYIGYNNGDNITTTNTYMGNYTSGANYGLGVINNMCIVVRTSQNADFTTPVVITPFLYIRGYEYGTNPNGQTSINLYVINSMLGPTTTPAPADLTKCVYVAPADVLPEARPISSMINSTFNDNLDNLIEFSFDIGFIPSVDATGITSPYIDLISFEDDSNNNYYMRFNNDDESTNYLNIDLYTNNDSTPFYNDNLGEISNQNITNFRIWATYIINNECSITSAQGYNNNILEKIYVYILGTANYRAGYEDGYGAGTLDGWEAGLQDGYTDGYTDGYGEGQRIGFAEGEASQIDTNWLMSLFGAVDSFLSIHIFPNITFGILLGIPFIISVVWFIIRQLRGGGGGD